MVEWKCHQKKKTRENVMKKEQEQNYQFPFHVCIPITPVYPEGTNNAVKKEREKKQHNDNKMFIITMKFHGTQNRPHIKNVSLF